jgi:DNA-directed RNA polymerase subunit RPC12/RpoP
MWHVGVATAPLDMNAAAMQNKAAEALTSADAGIGPVPGSEMDFAKVKSMYEFLCERCWHEVPADQETAAKPEHDCPDCGAEDAWVGPFAIAERFSRPADSWPLLTSPHYTYAGQPDRRINPR